MFSLTRIGMFVKRRSIEEGEAMRILREVRRNPVHDHADFSAMACIDKEHEVLGRTEARGWGEIPRHLIPPRTREWKFLNVHQLDVRIAHSLDVLDQVHGELPVTQ